MSEEQQVVTEAPETEAPVEATADMSVDEIMDIASKREEEPSDESTSSEETQEGSSEEDVKTEVTDDKETKPEETDHEESIPYERFKSVNEKAQELESKYNEQQAELAEARRLFQDPEVLKLALRKQGRSEEFITNYMQENGVKDTAQMTDEEYDLQTVEGWEKKTESTIDKKMAPILDYIKRQDSKEQESKRLAEIDQRLSAQKDEAMKLCKDVYDMEFGEFKKDERNPDTAIGKISSYLDTHPDKAAYGYADLLTLAMSEQGFKGAVDKGKQAEKERLARVKAAAMESDTNITSGEKPSADWSTERLMAYSAKHN